MPQWLAVALISLGGIALTGLGAIGGTWITARTTAKASAKTAEHAMIDQLQEELKRYRERTDKRLDSLELENRGYRAFIGVQRDHMAEHGIPLPPWPDGLPR